MELIILSAKLIIIGIVIVSTAKVLFNRVIIPYKLQVERATFIELLDILNAIIASELKIYEDDVIQTRITITNANFENYLTDLTTRIATNLSDQFYNQMRSYVTEHMIHELITRSVRNFLMHKINGSIE